MATEGISFHGARQYKGPSLIIKQYLKPLIAYLFKHSIGQSKTHGQAQYQLSGKIYSVYSNMMQSPIANK